MDAVTAVAQGFRTQHAEADEVTRDVAAAAILDHQAMLIEAIDGSPAHRRVIGVDG